MTTPSPEDSARIAALELANQELQQELQAFSYTVSHDLRAPLRLIKGFSKILLEADAGQLNQEARDNLDRITTAAERMGHMIDGLLALSRLSRKVIQRQAVNLSDMAGEETAKLAQAQPERQVGLTIQPGMTVVGDQDMVRIALQHLIGNAWKFTSQTPAASIEVGQAGHNGEMTFFVRDNGDGFDMRYAGKLFGPFQRLHTSRQFDGTGIGLSIVQRIVLKHGGRIWADAKPKQGCTLYFTFGPATHAA